MEYIKVYRKTVTLGKENVYDNAIYKNTGIYIVETLVPDKNDNSPEVPTALYFVSKISVFSLGDYNELSDVIDNVEEDKIETKKFVINGALTDNSLIKEELLLKTVAILSGQDAKGLINLTDND